MQSADFQLVTRLKSFQFLNLVTTLLSDLFWSVKKEKRRDVSETLVVETILNYGTLEDYRELFNVLGLAHTASIFFATTENRTRNNYFPEVENFFNLYFTRHVVH